MKEEGGGEAIRKTCTRMEMERDVTDNKQMGDVGERGWGGIAAGVSQACDLADRQN